MVEELQLQRINPQPYKTQRGEEVFLLEESIGGGKAVPFFSVGRYPAHGSPFPGPGMKILYVVWDRSHNVVVFCFAFSPVPWQAALSTCFFA